LGERGDTSTKTRVVDVVYLAIVLTLTSAGVVGAQHPAQEALAGKVVEKYQQSSCEQP
jgi:hypothetical protein